MKLIGVVAAMAALTFSSLAAADRQPVPLPSLTTNDFVLVYDFTVSGHAVLVSPLTNTATPEAHHGQRVDAIVCNKSTQSGKYYVAGLANGDPASAGAEIGRESCVMVSDVPYLALGMTGTGSNTSWPARVLVRPHQN